ncbi:MAG: YfhO family protein [Psychrobacillus sp.]
MKNIRRYWPIILAGVLAIVIQGVVYYQLEIAPFGENTILTTDLKGQYISFFSYLKNSLQGDDNLLYSMSKTMGGNMVGLTSYYLLSPLNIIFLCFKLEHFPIAITVLTLIKIGLMSSSFAWLMNKNKLPAWGQVVLGISYGLMSYSVVYQQNIMWLDTLILLPILIWSLDKLVKSGSWILYAITLGYIILLNYYMGFMICIFSSIYFISSLVVNVYGKSNPNSNLSNITVFRNFVIGSVVGGALSMVSLLPSIMSLQGGKAGFALHEFLNTNQLFTVGEFISKFIPGAYITSDIQHGLPNIYVFSGVLLLCLLFFFNRNINLGNKVQYFVILFSIFFSLKYSLLNVIWHGFNEPTWFPYRFSFLFTTILLLIAAQQIKYWNLDRITSLFSLFILVTSIYYIHVQNFEYITIKKVMLILTVQVALFILFWMLDKNKGGISRKVILTIIVCTTGIETGLNAYITQSKISYQPYEPYSNIVAQYSTIMETLKPNEMDLYRIEKNQHYDNNDPLLLNYPGLSHYSSNETSNILKFMENLGFTRTANWARYSYGSTSFADSLMGVKYIVSDEPLYNQNLKINDVVTVKENKKFIYMNTSAFPLGFTIQQNKNLNISESNIMASQNKLISEMFDLDHYYTPISSDKIRMEFENVERLNTGSEVILQKIDTEKSGKIHIYIENPDDQTINYYFDGENKYGVDIYHDNEFDNTNLQIKNHTAHSFDSNKDVAKLTLELKGDSIPFDNSYLFYSSYNNLLKMNSYAENNKLELSKVSPTQIEGNLPSSYEGNSLLLTIPYDAGWKVKVDGKKVNTYEYADALLGIKLPSNSKRVSLTFMPKGLISGILISSCALISIIIFILYKRKSA